MTGGNADHKSANPKPSASAGPSLTAKSGKPTSYSASGAIDKLLKDTSLMSLTDEWSKPQADNMDIDSFDEIMETAHEDRSVEETRTHQLRQLRDSIKESIAWLRHFDEKHLKYLTQKPTGKEATADIVKAVLELNDDLQDIDTLEEQPFTKMIWAKLVNILTRQTMLSKNILDKQNQAAANTAEWFATLSNMLEMIEYRATLLQIPETGKPEEARKPKGPERMDFEQLSRMDKNAFDHISISIGRDGEQNDPLCLSSICPEFILPGMKEEQLKHLEDENFRTTAKEARKCWCIDQALAYRKTAIFESSSTYDTIGRLNPNKDSAIWLARGAFTPGGWTQEKEDMYQEEVTNIIKRQVKKNIVTNEHLKRVICAAILCVFQRLPQIGEPIYLDKEEMRSQLNVYYCGLKHENFSTGWLKSDANHKIQRMWRGHNWLGKDILTIIFNSWDSFINWYNSLVDCEEPELIQEVFILAKQLADIWTVNSTNFDETKRRVQSTGWGKTAALAEEEKKRIQRERKAEKKGPTEHMSDIGKATPIGGGHLCVPHTPVSQARESWGNRSQRELVTVVANMVEGRDPYPDRDRSQTGNDRGTPNGEQVDITGLAVRHHRGPVFKDANDTTKIEDGNTEVVHKTTTEISPIHMKHHRRGIPERRNRKCRPHSTLRYNNNGHRRRSDKEDYRSQLRQKEGDKWKGEGVRSITLKLMYKHISIVIKV
ncbi:MAG: hypothetical protein GY696_05765 [Gammaproteobacteria bacterium]|nr:hypothetical protein [Gammaproteobacteria bacterium]